MLSGGRVGAAVLNVSEVPLGQSAHQLDVPDNVTNITNMTFSGGNILKARRLILTLLHGSVPVPVNHSTQLDSSQCRRFSFDTCPSP